MLLGICVIVKAGMMSIPLWISFERQGNSKGGGGGEINSLPMRCTIFPFINTLFEINTCPKQALGGCKLALVAKRNAWFPLNATLKTWPRVRACYVLCCLAKYMSF